MNPAKLMTVRCHGLSRNRTIRKRLCSAIRADSAPGTQACHLSPECDVAAVPDDSSGRESGRLREREIQLDMVDQIQSIHARHAVQEYVGDWIVVAPGAP